jgi:hypothetical protein
MGVLEADHRHGFSLPFARGRYSHRPAEGGLTRGGLRFCSDEHKQRKIKLSCAQFYSITVFYGLRPNALQF